MTERGVRGVIRDEKTAFYLHHWALIEEWAALRPQGVAAVEDALLGLVPRLAEAEDEGATLTVFDGEDERHPGFLLDRPSWRRGDVVVGVALRWERAQLLDPYGNTWPYVGVRVVGSDPLRRELRQVVGKGLEAEAKRLGWEETDSKYPYWRWVETRTDVIDPDQWADDCREALLAGWRAMSGPMDGLLAGP
jgi:hypothetical protein